MSEQYRCNKCGYVLDMKDMMCSECDGGYFEHLRWTKGGDGSHWEGCEDVHWDCKIAQLEARIAELEQELNTTDGLLKEATTKIDQFMTHYNDAVSDGKVSVDVKRDLSDAEIEELGAQEAESRGD